MCHHESSDWSDDSNAPAGGAPIALWVPEPGSIDAAEWCRELGLEPSFAFPAVLTARLCEVIERIPFRLLREVTAAERTLEVLRRAAEAFERRRASLRDVPPRGSATLQFSVPLPCNAGDRRFRVLHVQCTRAGDAQWELAVGLPGEFGHRVSGPRAPAEGAD